MQSEFRVRAAIHRLAERLVPNALGAPNEELRTNAALPAEGWAQPAAAGNLFAAAAEALSVESGFVVAACALAAAAIAFVASIARRHRASGCYLDD